MPMDIVFPELSELQFGLILLYLLIESQTNILLLFWSLDIVIHI
uniref:Uncharacterized protein n=1 Tax=Rhizophora mucronata TaxID=61149 RepID=A0A2P2NFY6_RHIMU